MNYRAAVTRGKPSPGPPPPPKIATEVYYRHTEWGRKSLMRMRDSYATCGEIARRVRKELEKTWNLWGFEHDPALIVLEGVKGPDSVVVIKKFTDRVLQDKVYTVYEIWFECPKTIRRRVKLEDAHVSTYSHPSVRTQYTKLASLACGAVPPGQDGELCFVSRNNGSARVLGMSVSMLDDARVLTDAEIKKPLGPVEYGESTGITKMSVAQFHSFIPEEEKLRSGCDVLTSSLTHRGKKYLVKSGIVKYVNDGGKNKQKDGCAYKISNYWQCGLDSGFDMKRHGLCLLLDNTSCGHGTIARSPHALVQIRERKWIPPSSLFEDSFGPFLPKDAMAVCQAREGPEFDAMLQNVAFNCVSNEELETIHTLSPSSKGQLVVTTNPKLAANFRLLEFCMEASAEPQSIREYRSGSQVKVYSAAVVLYHENNDSETQKLIEAVEEADYDLDNLDSIACEMLMGAVDDALMRLDYNAEGAQEQNDVLEEGRGILFRHINDTLYQDMPPTTPAAHRHRGAGGSSPESAFSGDSMQSGATAASSIPEEVNTRTEADHLEEDVGLDEAVVYSDAGSSESNTSRSDSPTRASGSTMGTIGTMETIATG